MKKLIYLLQKFDGIWSVPMAFFFFWFAGLLVTYLFGGTTAIYDLSFMQPLFLASGIIIGAANVAVLGLRFTFRGIHQFIYGYKDKEGNTINQSKEQWKNLSATAQIVISLLVFFALFFSVVIVYLKLV